MAIIRIDTTQIAVASNSYHSKRNELDALISETRSMINFLQGQFTGIRANRMFEEWEGLQPRLIETIEILQISGDLLARIAADFSAADSSF
jgi:WXG100 family type VII secretion target